MTTLSEADEALAQRFRDTWATTDYPTRFVLGNESDTEIKKTKDPWARMTSRISASTQETLGAAGCRKFERSGSLFVQVFTLAGTGTSVSKTLTQIVVDGFEGQRIVGTTVRFNDVIPRETGPEGKWYNETTEITFVFDETK